MQTFGVTQHKEPAGGVTQDKAPAGGSNNEAIRLGELYCLLHHVCSTSHREGGACGGGEAV